MLVHSFIIHVACKSLNGFLAKIVNNWYDQFDYCQIDLWSRTNLMICLNDINYAIRTFSMVHNEKLYCINFRNLLETNKRKQFALISLSYGGIPFAMGYKKLYCSSIVCPLFRNIPNLVRYPLQNQRSVQL